MDPNEMLRQIRAMMDDGDSADFRLIYLFNELDEWLTNGGFLPAKWERK